MSWEVYIIEAVNGNLYTGITNDFVRRFQHHQEGKGARFFRISPPKRVIYREKLASRSLASKQEAALKKLSRNEKLLHISPQKKGQNLDKKLVDDYND